MYISRRQLEAWGEPIGDMTYRDITGRYICYGGGKKAPKAPDYTPVAAASKEAAEIAAKLGREQLAESRRQYDDQAPIAKEISDAELALMRQVKDQGDDYYDYMVAKQRPVEDALNAEAMTGKVDAATQAAINEARDRAIADTRAGTTQQVNMIARQGLRYGWSPDKMAAMAKTGATENASAQVAAANAATDTERAKNWARRLDVAGLYRGLPGASQGAYGLAVNAGNSALQNKMAPGNALMSGMAQGSATTMQGQQIKMQGLSGILNSQTSMAMSRSNQGSPVMSLVGAGLGAWASGGFKGIG